MKRCNSLLKLALGGWFMSNSFLSIKVLGSSKFRIDMVDGVTKTHFLSICYAALTTIGLLTFISFATTYVLVANLGYAKEFDEAGRYIGQLGRAVGDLQVVSEIALLLIFLPVGLIADKIGRSQVYAFGMLTMGLSYVLYPLATGITELTVYRIVYAVGMGAATGMLGTVTADYPQDRTRGKMIGLTGIMNALGIIFVTLVFARLPETFKSMGYDDITSGKFAMMIVAGMCFITAIVVAFGLQKGTPTEEQKKIPYSEQIKAGLAEGKNLRILLAYFAAFVARSDLVILGAFLVAWGTISGMESGLELPEATSKARLLFVASISAALVASPFIGYLMDKGDRIICVSICMAMAAAGYGSMMFVENPLESKFLSLFMLLGVGQQCAFFAATTLLGQEAPKIKRGAVVGVFNLSGALGILICSYIGGRIFDAIDPSAPFVFMGICNIIVSMFAIYVFRKEKNAEQVPIGNTD